MVIYSFYIFDRHTECIYSKKWLPPSAAEVAPGGGPNTFPITNGGGGGPPGQRISNSNKASDDAKLIFGTVFSLRNMVRKLGGEDDAFISYRTGQYKLHFYETASNLRLVMLTDTSAPSMRNVLHQIYINLWVEYVVKNPLSPVEHKGGDGVRNELFEYGLDQFVRGLM
ncbi:Sybindin-like family protein [Naviculisporaceae sp. PSN 640]